MKLIALLVLQLAASSWPSASAADSNQQAPTVTRTGRVPSSATSSQLQATTATAAAAAAPRSSASDRTKDQDQSCQYEKLPWSECQTNGEQTRTLRLISGDARCPKAKLVRRECKQGCKYVRGEWSAECVNGQRVRVDTLVGRVESPAATASSKQQQQIKCEPQRKVTKDCRRACHYVKSAWSECVNGFKTRDLRLEELPQSPQTSQPPSTSEASTCAKHRQIKRECSANQQLKAHNNNQQQHEANKLNQKPSATSSQQQDQTTTTTQKLTLAQKRRLKQLQRQQQKQQANSNNNNNNKSAS